MASLRLRPDNRSAWPKTRNGCFRGSRSRRSSSCSETRRSARSCCARSFCGGSGSLRGLGDAVLLGSIHCAGTLRVREFLSRNAQPYAFVDLDSDADVQELLDRFHVSEDDIPVLICRGQRVLRNPTDEEIADVSGSASRSQRTASSTSSSSARARPDCQPRSMQRPKVSMCSSSRHARPADRRDRARASRTTWDFRPASPDRSSPAARQGSTVASGRTRSTWASRAAQFMPAPSSLQPARNIASRRSTNSAASRASVSTPLPRSWRRRAEHARRVHMLVRSGGLAATMSRYLIRRIEDHPTIELHPCTELVDLAGETHLGRRLHRAR